MNQIIVSAVLIRPIKSKKFELHWDRFVKSCDLQASDERASIDTQTGSRCDGPQIGHAWIGKPKVELMMS